jgi:alkanesulfonate monooxygenase SsuD/methylene tetrahydromethanopterin reductase-like flavin-dependent oxidoreductase (luciferase family)
MSPSNRTLRFSLFDWLDESGRGYAATYDERLALLEYADQAGFHAYLLAEHHGTSLSTTPSPSLFLAAAAQRTKRLRLGALTWLLPLYHPLRLLEELCMLDELSHGRIELGISRGSSPNEGKRLGVHRDDSRARFEEVLQLLVMGFTQGELDFHGKFHDFDHVKTRFRPVQKPYPPIWYPTSSVESMQWAGSQGLCVATSLLLSPTFDHVGQMIDAWREAFEAHRHEPGRLNGHVAEPDCALTTHVYVADTDEQAMAEAREGFATFNENYTRRYIEIGQGDKFANRPSFDQFVAQERLLCGSPETVTRVLGAHLDRFAVNHFIGSFTFGSLTQAQIRHSLELFATRVMPALAPRHAQAA